MHALAEAPFTFGIGIDRFNSAPIPELVLKDFEQKELELKDFEQKEPESNEMELVI